MSDAADTRGRILQSAREVFNEVGYERTTFKEIAARAGVTRPAVNHHFPGKGELFHAIFDATGAAVVGGGIANAERQSSVAKKFIAFLETAVQVDSADPSYARFISGSLVDVFRNPELAEDAQDQIGAVREFIRGALEQARDAGEIADGTDLSALTEMLIAVFWGMGLYAGFVGSHEQLESVVAEFSGLLATADW